ncbi:MAG TPA: hypothetical protein VE621_21700, partial [Bryobacteraceae bacterium]|nr:hypothetical protein [Bryobacteraceae bacterium]
MRAAPSVALPGAVDSNSPIWWADGGWFSITSAGIPVLTKGFIFPWEEGFPRRVRVDWQRTSVWFESVWRHTDGTLYAWYHHEPSGLCENGLTAPQIGAAVSYDNGQSFTDLGIILEAADSIDCDAKNGFFGGGHGDFSVIPDRKNEYFYFLFGNYGGPLEHQGISLARIPFSSLAHPVGEVWKWHEGEWSEPGVGGQVTPVWPARKAWQDEDTDSFWGPSIHWNTAIERYVIVMNHACCAPFWPQEGAYIAIAEQLEDPTSWPSPT